MSRAIIPNKHSVVFGALAPSLSKQLNGLGFTGAQLIKFEDANDAITLLIIRELLTDSQAHAARVKLISKIARAKR